MHKILPVRIDNDNLLVEAESYPDSCRSPLCPPGSDGSGTALGAAKFTIILSIVALILLMPVLGLSAQQEDEPPAVPGQVLVKLKPEFSYLNRDGKNMRSGNWNEIVPVLGIHHSVSFASFQSDKHLKSARTDTPAATDLRLYHQLSFDPSIPLAIACERLVKSGVVEIAEPVYADIPFQSPNDPEFGRQYYLQMIKAFDAWKYDEDSENEVVIAIVDTGVDLSHSDLAANIYRNEADPIDGQDNDGDGFLDNYWGWDFAGNDYNTLVGDNNPSTTLANASHGSLVAGCASAVTNNGQGIAGVANNAKLMILKHTADNDTRLYGRGYLMNVLQGVVYAASQGADIINTSYGSTYYSHIAHEIYRHVALEYGVLVVAAAGNYNSNRPFYPASYDHVLAVAASTKNDGRAAFSNYNYNIDITAPGEEILTTAAGGKYVGASGTSYSAPIVAGAAALLKHKYPEFTGIQLGELLRISADTSFSNRLQEAYKETMGRGRLDIGQAFVINSPSIRASNIQLKQSTSEQNRITNNALLIGDFTNYLWQATGVEVTISSLDKYVTVEQGVLQIPSLAMLEKARNGEAPFLINIAPDTPDNYRVMFRLQYRSQNYSDYQYVTVTINPTFFDIRENKIVTTVVGNGRIGHQNKGNNQGEGFRVAERNLMYDMALFMGVSKDRVIGNGRNGNGGIEDSYKRTNIIQKDMPGTLADSEVYGGFDDSGADSSRLGVEVSYHAYAWQAQPVDRMLIMEYTIKNTTDSVLSDFYLGLFADWDINPDGYKDKVRWDASTATGYVFAADTTVAEVVGIQLLTENPNYWAIDNDAALRDNPFGIYDGYTNEEKFKSMSGGIGRTEAGNQKGADVSHIVSAGPFNIAPGDSVVVAFALHGNLSVKTLLAAADAAKKVYQEKIVTPRIVLSIDPLAVPAFSAYPNPTKGLLYLELSAGAQPDPYFIRVFNAAGKQYFQQQFDGQSEKIALEMPQEKGLYFVEVLQGDRRVVKKIVAN